MITLKDYKPIIGPKEISTIEKLADSLQSQHIVHVNSVAVGGGVAELLNPLVVLANELGVRVGWRFLPGTSSFYGVTKRMHNALQSEKVKFTKQDFEVYHDILERTSIFNHFEYHNLVMVHNPQALGLIQFFKKRKQPWVWRCHIDLTKPDLTLWRKLLPWVKQYEAMVVSHKNYQRRDAHIPQHIIPPAIDPLRVKNIVRSKSECNSYLRKQTDLDLKRPFIVQISRFDKWKDPLGVIKIYKLLKAEIPNLQLVLMGDMAGDDPEGPEIYHRVMETKGNDKDIHILTMRDDHLVNALQTQAKVVLQWSKREGFGLVVAEALWKGTPVIARPVGGIPLQVINGKTGYLCKTTAEAARSCLKIIKNPKLRTKLGKSAREHVRKNFLITTLLKKHFELYNKYVHRY